MKIHLTGNSGRLRVQSTRLFLLLILLGIGCASPRQGQLGDDATTRFALAGRIFNLPSGVKNVCKVNIIVEVMYRDLQFINQNGRYKANVDYTFSLTNTDNPERVVIVDKKKLLYADSYAETARKGGFLRLSEIMQVPPGTYRAQLTIKDNNGNALGEILYTHTALDFISELAMTDPILMADSVNTFLLDKMIPLRKTDFRDDFYILFAAGGLQQGERIGISYSLLGSGRKVVSQNSLTALVKENVAHFSVPVKAADLPFGQLEFRASITQKGIVKTGVAKFYSNSGYRTKDVRDFTILIEPMKYIMSGDAYKAFRRADEQQQKVIFQEFWKKRDPDPETESNSLLEELYIRVERSNAMFSWGKAKGFDTDRGRIYILNGPPDRISRAARQTGRNSRIEVWFYEDKELRFIFIDRHNSGNFVQMISTNN